jgi:TonB family protein
MMTKEQTTGYIGSFIFCLLIFLFLYFTVLQTVVKSGEEGILVNFGTVDLSTGNFAANTSSVPTPTPTPPSTTPEEIVPQPVTKPTQPKAQSKPNTPPITQNLEQTAAIESAKRQQQEKERIEAAQEAAKAKAAEEERKRLDAINKQVSGAFSAGGSGQSQGTGQTGSGIQGDPNSTSPVGSPTGSGGYGEFNLGGRTLGAGGLPRPAYSIQEEGRIVISITVDPQGNVIFAEIGKGTNIDNGNMRKSALEAARKAKFNSISGNNNQSGTITYKYSLK